MTTWTAEIVRARFLEAADTAQRLPAPPQHQATGFWPAFQATFEDMTGWGSQRLAEEREMRLARIPPSSGAITRHDELLEWTARFIHDEEQRRIIWTWAICQASGRSFVARCRRHGWARATAHRRITAAIALVLDALRNSSVVLRLPDGKWLRQVDGVSGRSVDTLAIDADAPPISPRSHIFDGTKPVDTLLSPEAIAAFEKHLDQVNRDRRADRERKKRKLLRID